MTIQEDRVSLFPTRKFSFVKLSVFAALFAASALLCAVTQADIVMSLTKISSEADVFTNVPNASSVKYAINYGGQTVSNAIDGVTFVNQGGTSYYTVLDGYNTAQQSFTSRGSQGPGSHGGNTYSGTSSDELNKLLGSMMLVGGQNANTNTTLTFGNLEEGKTYTARILARAWDTNRARQHTFTIDLDADGKGDTFTYGGNSVISQNVKEDQPFSGETYTGAYAVDFTFTAQSNTATINLLSSSTAGEPWHNYGVMLIENSNERQTITPTIYNGSFEADKWVLKDNKDDGHGYLDRTGNTGVISGWQYTNLTNSDMKAGMAWVGCPCKDFIGTQTPPDGNQLGWLQSNNTDARLYQNVYGFNPDDKNTVYRLTMELGGRTATANPSVSLFIGANPASLNQTTDLYINSKEVTKGQFKEYSAVFAPNADMQTIAIRNQTEGDTTLLIDNVQLQAYELTTFFSDNFNVSGNRKGPNIGTNASDLKNNERFAGGLLGPMAYKVSVVSNDQIQVGNGANAEALFFATHKDNGYDKSHASPDYNFANVGAMTVADEGGRMYDISFRVSPQYDEAADSTNWAAVIFGLTQGKQTSANVSTGDGVGILFRRNGGIQIFDGTNNSTTAILNFGAGTFALTNDWADVRVVYYVPAFDGTSPVEVSLYVNDILISSFQTEKGFKENFIQLEGYSNADGYKRSLMDDLAIKATAELNYDVSRIQDLNREWAPNGKDKLDVFFNAPRSDTGTEAVHTGALTLDDNVEINVDEGYTLKQTGDVTGNHTITKTGDGVLQIYGAAAGDVDIQSLVISSGRVDAKGYMKGSVLVGEGAVFSPGNSVGEVTINGEFKLEDYATLLIEIGTDESGNAVSDLLIINGAFEIGENSSILLTLDEDSTLGPNDSINVDLISGTGVSEDTYQAVKDIISSYYFKDITVAPLTNGVIRLAATVDPNAVPEPSTWALLILGACGLFYLRKRR